MTRDRAFLKLWAAQGVSQLGTQISLIALPLAALFTLHRGALAVSLLRAFGVLPFLLFSLPAGVWVDRLRRRPLMIAADAGRALAVGSIPVAYALGSLTLAQLYAVAFAAGSLSVLFDVAYLSFLPGLVGRARLPDANAKLLGTQYAAGVVGPGAGGALVAGVGAAVAVAADAVSFAASGALLTLIRHREPPPERVATRAREELAEGIRYVFSQPYLRTLTITFSVANLFTSAYFALMIVYLARGLRLGATRIGIVVALAQLGFVAAAFLNARVVRSFGLGRTLVVSCVLSNVALLSVPLAPRVHPEAVLVGGGFVGTLLGMFANVNQLTLRQAITPPRLLGRMNSVARFMYWGTIPAGAAIGGVAAATVGLRATLLGATVGAIAANLPLLASGIRHVDDLPAAPAEEPLLPRAAATVTIDA